MKMALEQRARRAARQEIWEVENWGTEEWVEQFLAEIAFCKGMNVQFPDSEGLVARDRRGSIAGYRVRRAPNGLVLVASDNDDDIFVAVRMGTTEREQDVLGWLRGSEGKLSRFYQKNCWVVPPEALHDLEKLPGKERLRAMPSYQGP
jgi:hypothetical protein